MQILLLSHSLDVEVPLVARLLRPQDAEAAVADEHRVVDAQDVRVARPDPRDLQGGTRERHHGRDGRKRS